jgi:hypothetical protein
VDAVHWHPTTQLPHAPIRLQVRPPGLFFFFFLPTSSCPHVPPLLSRGAEHRLRAPPPGSSAPLVTSPLPVAEAPPDTSPLPAVAAPVGTSKTGYPRVQAPGQDRRPAPGPPRVLRAQLPLPNPGQLRGRHVSCGPSSCCPARGSSGAATCPADPPPADRPGAVPGPPRVLRTQLPLPSPG